MKAASIRHPSRLLYAKISDTAWSLYMLAMSKVYNGDVQNSQQNFKVLVANIGKQPNSNIWVFGPNVQINHLGEEIPRAQHTFYW